MNDRDNNFDLIRLFAATQVAVVHILDSFHLLTGAQTDMLRFFPGVPVFFFISGFLVSGSLERNPDPVNYFRNRALRIFPGLWTCLAFSLVLVYFFYDAPWLSGHFAAWLVGQITVVQFYNPDFFRGFGTGVLNGSLWTIPVELQYYLVLPLIYWLAGSKGLRFFVPLVIVALAVHTVFVTRIYGTGTFPARLMMVTIAPWLGFFMVGVIAQRLWPKIRGFFRGKALVWLAVYTVTATLLYTQGIRNFGNAINAGSAIILFAVVLSAAYTLPELSNKVLRGNDISYGMYLYHIPLLNVFLVLGWSPSWLALGGLLAITTLCATLSWVLVEKPALALKHRWKTPMFSGRAKTHETMKT